LESLAKSAVRKYSEGKFREAVQMAVYKQSGSKNWWYKFTWNGQQIRESTKQTNKRLAEQIEAAHKASLARGEVGIRDKEPVPTLAGFADELFLPFVRSTSAAKPNTIRFYENSVANLKANARIASLPIDQITSEAIAAFVAHRQNDQVQVATVNRDLATLRRIFHLATEWGKVFRILPRVRLLSGENHRERVLSFEEEAAYRDAAADVGNGIEEAYKTALKGIRAQERGQQPKRPDSYLLCDVATILIDCALRPEECFRLKWENFRDGLVDIHKGKGKGSRRRIPASQRVQGILEMRKGTSTSEWIFPAPTRSGHIEASSIKKQHAAAIAASGVPPFVLYTFRHTCLTRWAKHMDPFTLHILAGHTDMNTTKRYIHPNETHIREAMAKVWGGHSFGHSHEKGDPKAASDSSVTDSFDKDLSGATRRDRTGDLLITNQPLYQLS
jgi:integrase